MKANGHLLPIPDFRLLLTLTPSAKTTHSSIFYMLPFCLVLLIPFAYSHAAKNRSLIKSPLVVSVKLSEGYELLRILACV